MGCFYILLGHKTPHKIYTIMIKNVLKKKVDHCKLGTVRILLVFTENRKNDFMVTVPFKQICTLKLNECCVSHIYKIGRETYLLLNQAFLFNL